ncbi:unnamed protein product [Rotaria sordida]|uniref:Uncharacterized protein n=1 Tax=Rotaria sordida TaxID=392033 RepID=A0A819G6Y2_9BILA|nr:unnamed protein product [Rotaria sordida]
MEDRDGKKTFVIPKTRTSNKDVLITEKTDSRNVTELFDDIKSCSLEAHFDFRQNECKSCETIRNQKLQKLYNERKTQMKKDQDPTERFAFHLITSRDIALNIATDGITCEQLSFSLDKYLGNPKDGIHLSRRPDVLLASSGIQGLHKFGLLICKIILGKGYATIPSINNKQLSAQLHYDHHFCKVQSLNKEQRHIDDLLANSLVSIKIFCYEHEDLKTLSRPSQILPLAILWYDLKEKFSSKLTSTSQESQQNNDKPIKLKNSNQNKSSIKSIPKPISTLNTGTWDDLTQESTNTSIISTISNKYPSQLMLPLSSFSNLQPLTNYRDPRLIRTVISSEIIPLSPQHPINERSQLDGSSLKSINNTKKNSLINIPLNSTIELIDPRLPTYKSKQNIFYLELKAVKHALQQQKRLNNYYYNSKNNTKPKTNYTLIPFLIRSMSADEYETNNNNNKVSNQSSYSDYSSLFVSVVDCFHFGLKNPNNKLYIDLEENDNKLAYEQINISNQLIQYEKQLNSQEIRLHLREKRQRKIQEYFNQQKKNQLANSRTYINLGRKVLKEHQIITTSSLSSSSSSSNQQISLELLDFFCYEYQHENRPNVKRLLAELIGVFVDKYGLENKQTTSNNIQDKVIEDAVMDDQTINTVIDMDLESPSSQGLCDYDERFRAQTPQPPSVNESTYNQLLTSLPITQTLSIETNKTSDELNNNNNIELVQPIQIDLPLSITNITTDNVVFKSNNESIEFPSNENNNIDNNHSINMNNDLTQIINSNSSMDIENDSTRSRDEFVKLLTKEVYTIKSPSPSKILNHRRRSYDNDESNINKNLSSTRTVTLVSKNYEDNIIIETTNMNQEKQDEEPTVKRLKITSNSDTDSPIKIIDDHDYRQDLDERKRQIQMNKQSSRSRSRSKSTSSRNSSIKESKTRSPSSSSSSRASSISNRYRRQQQNEYNYEHQHSSDRSYHYHQRNINNSTSIHSQPIRHQRFNYNHQSVADHPRFANLNTRSTPIKSLMYDSFNTSNYSQSITDYHDRSTITNTNQNFNSSYYNEISSNYQNYSDNQNNNLPPPQPLMSTTPAINFSYSYDSKPSNTIERLQMILQNRSTTSYEHEQTSINDYSSSSYAMNPSQNSNKPPWSSTR